MPAMNDQESIKQQYASADGLQIRRMLHQKYSINKQPYDEWISEHYRIQPGMNVLELGCGTGVSWADAKRWLPDSASLLLTDFSEGMLKTARSNVPDQPNISFAQVDIQQIPYENDSFDLVIANAMLYHVPDLDKAISEVARVLKPDGRFICSTTGDNGMHQWFQRVLGEGESPATPFSLQNGGASLEKHFGKAEMRMREDGLEVTDVNDLAAYVRSTISFGYLRDWPPDEMLARLSATAVDGIIRIPKEYGLFICTEPKKR
ncbi:MAG: methyltransferase domain-containing protein [Clostridia bacterium]|nr:methyltransferase domain-containing protein [Clostridia bacterium]